MRPRQNVAFPFSGSSAITSAILEENRIQVEYASGRLLTGNLVCYSVDKQDIVWYPVN